MSKEVGEMVRSRKVAAAPTEGARRATGVGAEGAVVGAGGLAPGQRWSASRKRDVVLRLLRGKSPAGFLRSSHRECREAHAAGVEQIADAMGVATLDAQEAGAQIAVIAKRHNVRDQALTQALSSGWARCIEQALARDGVTRADEARLDALLAHFGATRADFDGGGLWAQVEARRRRDAETRISVLAKEGLPETFKLGDGWFAYNLLKNIEVP